MEPFQIFGNLYYVGDEWVCVHLIDTGDGLLLIDAGNFGTTGMLVHAIWSLGFNPADVKWIILSHGHMDHIGAAWFFRDMFGTELYLGKPDAQMFREHPEYSHIQNGTNYMDMLFEPDVEIEDGDVLTFGNVVIQTYLVPGHTAGCVALFFDVTDGKEKKRAGYYGGFGVNTLRKEALIEMEDYEFQTRQVYLNSIEKVIDQKVEIFLGNHTKNNHTVEKRQRMLNGSEDNPFLDEGEWKQYLSQMHKTVEEMITDSNQN